MRLARSLRLALRAGRRQVPVWWAVAAPRSPSSVPSRCGIRVAGMGASMLEVGLVREVATEFAFEVVLWAVARFPQVGPALPRIHGSGPRRFSVGLARQAACIPAAVRERAAVEAVAFVSSIPPRFSQSVARCR